MRTRGVVMVVMVVMVVVAGLAWSLRHQEPALTVAASPDMPGEAVASPVAAPPTTEPSQPRVHRDPVVPVADTPDRIEGIVLDDDERPVPDLTLQPSSHGSGRHRIVATRGDGRFRHERQAGESADPVGYAILTGSSFEAVRDERRFPWGTEDLVLRVRRSPVVEVQAVEAGTGAPITRFAVRCFRELATDGASGTSDDCALREKGWHDQGRVRLKGVRRGTNMLMVEPEDRQTFAPMAPVRFVMTDRGAPPQIVSVPRFATRTLEVVLKDGTPVAGTRVEVVVPLEDHPITMRSFAIERQERFQRGDRPEALLASETQTDAAGRCELRGPERTHVCLRVLGPGHVPRVVAGVLLGGEPLRLVVSRGATLTGKVVPASLLPQWAPSDAEQSSARRMGRYSGLLLRNAAPGLTLSDPRDPRRKKPEDGLDRLPLAEGGTFRIEGIEPGDWDVRLWYRTRTGTARAGGSEVLARVAGLVDGETRELVLDATILVPGELRGLVLVDGEPYADAEVGLLGTRADGRGGTTWLSATNFKTDGQGRFAVSVQSGDWTLTLARFNLLLPTVASVGRGETTAMVFRFDRQQLCVRLIGANDQPVARRDVGVQAGQAWRDARTDADGRFMLDPALPGTMSFCVWPEHLATKPQRSHARQDEEEAARIPLGEFTIPAGQKSAEVTLRLPR